MSADPAKRRRSTAVALVSGLVVVAAIPAMSVAAWRAIRDSRAAQNVGVITSLALPATPTALVAAVDEADEVTSITVLALRPKGGGGTIVSVPVGSRSLSSLEFPRRVADAYTLGGADALLDDVESLMSATMSASVVVAEDELADLLAPFGEVDVTLAADLRDSAVDPDAPPATDVPVSSDSAPTTDPLTTDVPVSSDSVPAADVPSDDSVTDSVTDVPVDPDAAVLVPSGTSRLDATELAAALTARVTGEPESARLPEIGAIWEGLAVSIGSGRGEPPADDADDPTEVADMIAVLASGPVDVWQVSSIPIVDPEKNPEGLDLYKVRSGEIALVMASVAPSAMTATLPGPTMQLDSSFGDADTSLAAVELLHFFSINVMLAREVEGDPPERSIVRYAEVGDAEDFSFLEEIIGPFDVERIDSRVEGIDFEVVLGESFVPFLEELDFDPSADVVPEDSIPDDTDTDTDTGTDAGTGDVVTDSSAVTTAPGEDG